MDMVLKQRYSALEWWQIKRNWNETATEKEDSSRRCSEKPSGTWFEIHVYNEYVSECNSKKFPSSDTQ